MAMSSQPAKLQRVRDGVDFQALLTPTATTSERVHGLLALGLHASDVARTTGVSSSALRNWSAGQAEPRSDAAITLDDLRTVVKVLLDGGLNPERAVRWLTSRDPERFGEDRPLDLLRTKPMSVLAAAHGAILDAQLFAVEAKR